MPDPSRVLRAGDDIVEPVSVDIVHRHHAAAQEARLSTESLGMIVPRLLLAPGRRLFPPAVAIHYVGTLVAVDVAGADACGYQSRFPKPAGPITDLWIAGSGFA